MSYSGLQHLQQEDTIFGIAQKKIGFSLVSFFNLLIKRCPSLRKILEETDFFFSPEMRSQICITANYCLNVSKSSGKNPNILAKQLVQFWSTPCL